jgi:hypothetical protein
MTKNQAMYAMTHLSSGTIATLTGKTKYEQIDAIVCRWISFIAAANETAFSKCENWMDVLAVINRA